MKEHHIHILEILEIISRCQAECPWTKVQKPEEIIAQAKSELAEVETALANNDMANLEEELGDVLYDILLLMSVCKVHKNIDVKKSLTMLRDKMIRRKPYLYGDEKAETVEDVLRIWKRVKEEEKNKK